MKLLISLLAVVALLALLGATAKNTSTKWAMWDPIDACHTVSRKSFYQISCSYDYQIEIWTLSYRGHAYRLTHDSGQHGELLEFLCRCGGERIREKHNGKVEWHDC